MRYEVENKFPVPDLEPCVERLVAMGASIEEAEEQVDVYLSHPGRDFAATDEALRIRSVGDENRLTYKGARVGDGSKTRPEIELAIASGSRGREDLADLFRALGFGTVAEVRKRRRPVRIPWRGETVAGALDEVQGLGSFVELEIMADAEVVAEARRRLTDLSRELALSDPEPRSYLELLLERT